MARAVCHCVFERFGVRKAETLRRNSRGSSPDAADLRALETQIVHQSLLIKDEGDDRAGEGVGVDGTAGANSNHHDRSIDADLPTIGVLEASQGLLCHEHDDDGSRLDTELEAEGSRDDIVIPGGFPLNDEDTFSVFPAHSKTCLDDGGKHENAGSLPAKLASGWILSNKASQRGVDPIVDLRYRGRLTGLGPCDKQHTYDQA